MFKCDTGPPDCREQYRERIKPAENGCQGESRHTMPLFFEPFNDTTGGKRLAFGCLATAQEVNGLVCLCYLRAFAQLNTSISVINSSSYILGYMIRANLPEYNAVATCIYWVYFDKKQRLYVHKKTV